MAVTLKGLVDGFAKAMRSKLLAKSRDGWSGWEHCSEDELERRLLEHLARALRDPNQWVDVANFCAFLWWQHQRSLKETSRKLALRKRRRTKTTTEKN